MNGKGKYQDVNDRDSLRKKGNRPITFNYFTKSEADKTKCGHLIKLMGGGYAGVHCIVL